MRSSRGSGATFGSHVSRGGPGGADAGQMAEAAKRRLDEFRRFQEAQRAADAVARAPVVEPEVAPEEAAVPQPSRSLLSAFLQEGLIPPAPPAVPMRPGEINVTTLAGNDLIEIVTNGAVGTHATLDTIAAFIGAGSGIPVAYVQNNTGAPLIYDLPANHSAITVVDDLGVADVHPIIVTDPGGALINGQTTLSIFMKFEP